MSFARSRRESLDKVSVSSSWLIKNYHAYYALSALDQIGYFYQERRAPLRFAACPWLSYSAPLALPFRLLGKDFSV